MSGVWVFVCGASGAGKDSVMAWAQQRLTERPDIVFSRRVVTREAQPGAEDTPVTLARFDALRLSGGLSWHWRAHDLRYGIGAHYAAAVQEGRTVVVNGSREHVQGLAPGADIRVVQILAEPQQLANRLHHLQPWGAGGCGPATSGLPDRRAQHDGTKPPVKRLNQ
jgi:ribose 1,5-bisphosphokinase